MWPNPEETADLVTFTKEIPNGKLHFLCSALSRKKSFILQEQPLAGVARSSFSKNFKRFWEKLQILQRLTETIQTSKMELFAKIVNDWNPLTIFAKSFILDVYVGFEYASALLLTWIRIERLCSVYNWASQLCPWKFWKTLYSVVFTERYPLHAVRKLNVHKTCTLNSCTVSVGTDFRDIWVITCLRENYWLNIKGSSLRFWWEWSMNYLPVQLFSPLHDL